MPDLPGVARDGAGAAGALFALVAALTPQAEAQLVMGRVSDAANGRPVEDALVRVVTSGDSVGRTSATSRTGRFFVELESLHPEDVLIVEQLGYETQHVILGDLHSFHASGVEVDIAIPPEPLALEGLVATVEAKRLVPGLARRGFYNRQRYHFGQYFVIDEVERNRAMHASDYLVAARGVILDRVGHSTEREPRLTRSQGVYGLTGGRCYPSIVLDGLLVRRGGQASEHRVQNTTFDALLSANHIQALEVYTSSQAPARWGGLIASCGVLVVWTRVGDDAASGS